MKHFILLLLTPLLLQGHEPKEEKYKRAHHLEARAGYFLFTKAEIRDIYDTGSLDLELEYNYLFFKRSTFWTNFNFTWNNGHSTLFSTPSSMDLSTLSIGAKQCFPFFTEALQFYLGMGISAAIINTKDSTEFIPRYTTRFSPGLVWKTGFLLILPKHWILNAYFDYYLQPTTRRMDTDFYSQITDIGGFRTGLGLGYLF